ncbi:HAD family hydrolase [Granulicella arctica]|uniref:Beta-phosphoglucomutase-like phosphatase (HAD superfamily) n=1 Tax=Granulicella arctica TaxID=940613 RepID=A0A7Y9PKZ1_9BACT|nr:HAD family phosphatase [Granulicella arctica]NYF80988.1 beta-phosphoglucomutase-like phosphatase (HAD superfamily) [Granulicella arctica]
MTTTLHEGSFDALIFDCDNTLVDTAPAHLSALRVGLKHFGLEMTDAFYYPRAGLTPRALFDDFEAEVVGAPIDRQAILGYYAVAFQNGLSLLQEISEVAEIARIWKGKVPMAVGSNGQRANVEATLAVTHLLPLFDFVVVASDVAQGKPAPDIYLEAARRMKVAPERCVVFEDSDEGLEAAYRAGMDGRDIRAVYKPAWSVT